MKNLKSILVIFSTIIVLASCMGDNYPEPDKNSLSPYGNNSLKEENVIPISELKSKYADVIATDFRNGKSYKKIDNNIQIKGIVTSSDVQGNIYNEIAIQDKTGAIIISVAQGGLYSFLPIGTEILVNLKDLYVGNYGLQAQIGVPTRNARGLTSIGRISRANWAKHFKILSSRNKVEPIEFANGNTTTKWDLTKDCGRLGIIKNVTFKSSTPIVNGTYANSTGGPGSVSWKLVEQPDKSVIVYNSNFADFANVKIPKGKVNITGIFKRFNKTWEIIIRTIDDVQPVSKNK